MLDPDGSDLCDSELSLSSADAYMALGDHFAGCPHRALVRRRVVIPCRAATVQQAESLREGDRGLGRPSGLISPFEFRWTRAMNELTETTMAASIA